MKICEQKERDNLTQVLQQLVDDGKILPSVHESLKEDANSGNFLRVKMYIRGVGGLSVIMSDIPCDECDYHTIYQLKENVGDDRPE
jgi:hypothetical protein